MSWKKLSWCMLTYRKQLLAIIIPCLLLPLPLLVKDQKAECGYVVLLMISFWILHIVPIPITAVIPFFLFPMMGILSTADIATHFFKEFTMTNMGGFIVANGMEKSGLHRRLALRVLLWTGPKQHLLLLGVMIPTFLLSMWISNIAVCVMMMSIVDQMLDVLRQHAMDGTASEHASVPVEINTGLYHNAYRTANGNTNAAISLVSVTSLDLPENTQNSESSPIAEVEDMAISSQKALEDDKLSLDDESVEVSSQSSSKDGGSSGETSIDRWFHNQRICYVLAVAYVSKAGGAANITGTPSNLVIKDLADQLWQENGFVSSPLNFTSWLVFSLPAQVIAFFCIWAWFCLYFIVWGGCTVKPGDRVYGKTGHKKTTELLREQYTSLGNIRYTECMVGVIMVILILLWFFLEPGFMTGWASGFTPGFVTLAVPSSMVMVAMFLIPADVSCKGSRRIGTGSQHVDTLGDFKRFIEVYPWGVMLMIGGGNALASGMQKTGLTDWISGGLVKMNDFPKLPIMLVLCLLVTAFTEVIANGVAVQIFTPIAAYLAEDMGKNPLYLLLPVALTCTYSFILPTAGAVNAWIITSGYATVSDNLRVGVVTNLLFVFLTILSVHTWGTAYFDLDTLPWVSQNSTGGFNHTTPSFLGHYSRVV